MAAGFPSLIGPKGGAACSEAVGVADGFASTGVIGVASLACRLSRFFSAVLRNALVVIRNDLLGLQSSAEMGVCSQTGHVEGSDNLPDAVSDRSAEKKQNRMEPTLTVLTNHLLAAGCSEGIDGQLAADGATKFDGDLVLWQRAGDKSQRRVGEHVGRIGVNKPNELG